mmetsp:Transcript_41963/g.101961  ORF Transcript_41963/g.101961 Transcript_41963/m.101961 type:complete len:85 (+) Transcript_41963:205-459(+)
MCAMMHVMVFPQPIQSARGTLKATFTAHFCGEASWVLNMLCGAPGDNTAQYSSRYQLLVLSCLLVACGVAPRSIVGKHAGNCVQ